MSSTWGLLGKHVILLLDSALTGETEPVCQFIKGNEEKISSNKARCVFYEPQMQQNTNDLLYYQFFWESGTDVFLQMDLWEV